MVKPLKEVKKGERRLEARGGGNEPGFKINGYALFVGVDGVKHLDRCAYVWKSSIGQSHSLEPSHVAGQFSSCFASLLTL
jgi:hypothetical protein